MIKRITNYSCRYVPVQQSAYIIIQRPCVQDHLDHKLNFYTVPFYNKQTHDTSNALLAFQCESIAKAALQAIERVQEHQQHQEHEVFVVEHPIVDVINYGAMLRIPTVVILSMYCRINDDNSESDGTCNVHYEILYNDLRFKKYDPSNSFNNLDYPS